MMCAWTARVISLSANLATAGFRSLIGKIGRSRSSAAQEPNLDVSATRGVWPSIRKEISTSRTQGIIGYKSWSADLNYWPASLTRAPRSKTLRRGERRGESLRRRLARGVLEFCHLDT